MLHPGLHQIAGRIVPEKMQDGKIVNEKANPPAMLGRIE
jgi:hypothetical protein